MVEMKWLSTIMPVRKDAQDAPLLPILQTSERTFPDPIDLSRWITPELTVMKVDTTPAFKNLD